MKTAHTHSRHQAFTFVELFVIIAVLALLVVLFLPSLSKCSCKAIRINCTNNLKQDGLAFRMWSDDNGVYPMKYRTNNFDGPSFAAQQMYVYFQTMSNELSTPKILVCPGDDRMPATNFASLSNTNISYFLGMDAVDESTPQAFLAGDRNLTTNAVPVPSGLALIKSTDTIGWTQKFHQGLGNVAFADGSIQGMRQVPGQPSTNINRLALP